MLDNSSRSKEEELCLHSVGEQASGRARGHGADEEPGESLADLSSLVPPGDCEKSGRDEPRFAQSDMFQLVPTHCMKKMAYSNIPEEQSGSQIGAVAFLEHLQNCH